MVTAADMRVGLALLEGGQLERLLLHASAMDDESRQQLQRDNGVPFLRHTQRLLDLCLSTPSLYPAMYLFLVGDTGPECFESFPDGELQLGTKLLTRSGEGYSPHTYRVGVVNGAHLNMYYRELRRRYASHPRYYAIEALMIEGVQNESMLRGLCDQLFYEDGGVQSVAGVATLILYSLRALHPTHAARMLLADEPQYLSFSKRYANFLEEFLPYDTSADEKAAWRREQSTLQLEVAVTLTDEHPYGPPVLTE